MANVPTKKLKVAGKFGSYGEPGATFTPDVSEDGILSWTNDGGLNNPAPVNVKGIQGDPGVYIGTETPTDDSVSIWLDPEDDNNLCIPSPTTAEVGQTVVVKSVDENGKPTEWEAKTDYPAYADPEGWEHIKTVTVAASDEIWRLIINKNKNDEKFAYDELFLITDNLAATSASNGRIFINRLSPYQNYYTNFSNFFVTNAQSGGKVHIRFLRRSASYNDQGLWYADGQTYTIQSRTNTGSIDNFYADFDGDSGMNAWNSEEFAKKMCSFGIQTGGDTVYMRGTFRLYGRNYK